MKRTLCLIAALVMLLALGGGAAGENAYLIADSSQRLLTEGELWGWNYEALGYIFNEIFARHGYVFTPGGSYDQYFRRQSWYSPNADSRNDRACYPYLSNLEWKNVNLVKQIRQTMRDTGNYNRGGKSVWDNYQGGYVDTLSGFTGVGLKANQTLAVYSAPSYSAWRGANGRASVSTNGRLWAAGYERGWMLVMYETNQGGVRVGYVSRSELSGKAPDLPELGFSYVRATVQYPATLTDDPARVTTALLSLNAGDQVTFLTNFYNRSAWAYVETNLYGETVRGFLPADTVALTGMTDLDLAGDGYIGGDK